MKTFFLLKSLNSPSSIHSINFRKRILVLVLLVITMQNTLVNRVSAEEISNSASIDHSLFSEVLSDHVENGVVNYKAIKEDSRFFEYIEKLKNTVPDSMAKHDRLAFWINVYNAFIIKVVVDKYPIKSIMSKFKYALKKSNFHKKSITINGIQYSLNDVENDIIRPMGDPRIHFAIVCAAKSCPPLRSEAYEPEILDKQLDDQGKVFLSQTDKNKVNFDKKELKVSKIFDWFKDDFKKDDKDVNDYIIHYLPAEDAAKIKKIGLESFKIKYTKYDWKLNN